MPGEDDAQRSDSYTRPMNWWLEDEVDFAGVGAALGATAGVLAIANSSDDAWIFLLIATAIVVARAFWRTMPAWFLILAPAVPVMVTEIDDTANNGWFIVCVALLVGVAGATSRLVWVPVTIVVVAPPALWIFDVSDYREHGFWTWSLGLLLSAVFGALLRRQRELIQRLEATQRQLADAAAAEERSRIAHELHDVVGHSFSVVLLHLSGARRTLDSDPERARQALAEAEAVGRRSMNDLRDALVLLRSDDDTYAPVAGLDALPALIDEFRQAGLSIEEEITGDPCELDPASGVVLHGVAREALTNAAKYGTGTVTMSLDLTDRPRLTVANDVRDGITVPAAGSGRTQGLDGMRHRVDAVGGRLDVAVVDRRWTVSAELRHPGEPSDRAGGVATSGDRAGASHDPVGDDLIVEGSG